MPAPFGARATSRIAGSMRAGRGVPLFVAKEPSGPEAVMPGDGCGMVSLPLGGGIADGLIEAGGKAGPDAPRDDRFGKGVRVRGDPRDAKTASEHLAPLLCPMRRMAVGRNANGVRGQWPPDPAVSDATASNTCVFAI